MKWFRRTLRESRTFILALLAVEVFYMVDGRNYIHARQVHEQKEARLKEISELLDIPVEKLRPDHETLSEFIRKLFVEEKDPVKEAGLKRLQDVLKKHEQQLAANPYLPQIEEVKREHAVYRIEGLIQDLMQLTEPREDKALPEASQRALLRNLHHGLRDRLELPPLPEGSPAKAQAKHTEMQAKLDRLFDSVRPIVAETQEPQMMGTLAQKIGALRALQAVETKRSVRPPRFGDRPLPLRRVEKKAPTLELSAAEVESAAKGSALATAPSEPPRLVSKAGIAPEIVALAESLGRSPAKIFSWVHDNIDFDPKWGAFKGPLGTLWGKSGTSWDQAWLLRDLLVAAGVDARFEWGEIEISTELLTNLTGLDDPFRAGDLMTTAGVPIVLLTEGSRVVAARMSHVWVRAFVDYIPNRGATPGPGDHWIRMDPSLKRYTYAPGIPVHEDVGFSLGDYLQSGTELSPRRAHEEALWAYIRANGIECTTLEQLKKAGSIVEEAFPFLPGSLRAEILRVDGEAPDIPSGFKQRLRLEVRAATGASLLSWESTLPELTGQRIEIGYEGATADDQATLDSHGGVFETPPYLVDLKPVLKVGGVKQASGGAVGSAEDVGISVTFTPVNGAPEVLVHDGFAGEPSVLVTDFGRLPGPFLERHLATLVAAEASGDATEAELALLQVIGATYMRNLGRDLEDLAGWNWHRVVRILTEGLVAQTGSVSTTIGGDPLSFSRAETFVDIAGMILGLFHTEGRTGFIRPTLELVGAQGSFLEGEVFEQVIEQEGIAAVSALTKAHREGQALTQLDGSNVDAVLASVDLGGDVESEIRSAINGGKIAWVPQMEIDVNQWRGTGYVLIDPTTGAGAYLLSGGFAGGAETGKRVVGAAEALGDESWLSNGPLGEFIRLLIGLFGGSPGDDDDPESNQGDPVNLATGNYWRTETDLRLQARGLPIFWSRTYNSRSTYNGPLGYGWTFSYGEALVEQPDGSVIYREDDGTEHLFTINGGAFTPPPGKHLVLTGDASGFDLRSKDAHLSRFDVAGKLVSKSDRNGNTVTLIYDGAGHLSQIIDAAGRTALSVTTIGDKISAAADLAGRQVAYGYTDDDLTSVSDSTGHTWTFTYDANHNLTAISNPLGETDSFQYDSFDRCIRHVNPPGEPERYTYSSRGRRAVVTDRRGYERFLEFDDRGRAVLEVDALGNSRRSTWDAGNNRTSTTDPRGRITTRTFDDRGNLLSETNPLGETTQFTYDPVHNQVLTNTDPSGRSVTLTYDSAGNLLRTSQVVDAVNVQQEFLYDAFGEVIELRDARGFPSTFSWDETQGVVETVTDAASNTTTLIYDAVGRVTDLLDPEGNLLEMGYDAKGRITSVHDPFGNSTGFSYDTAGRQIAITNSRGTAVTEYDAAGRAVAATDVLGNRTVKRYDAVGNIVETIDARGATTTRTYDALGRMTSLADPSGAVWTFGYCAELGSGRTGADRLDPSGGFCEMTDPIGHSLTRELDELGRVTRMTDSLGLTAAIQYDELGRKVRTLDPLGRETRFEYNALGDLTAVVQPGGGRAEYSYDQARNRVNIRTADGRDWPSTYDMLNRLNTSSDPLGNTMTFYYDGLGNLIRKVKPDGQEITYGYDVQRLVAVNLPGGSQESYGYDSLGRRTSMVTAEVSLTYAYDELSRLSQVTNNTLQKTITYEYDAVGNLVRMDGPRGAVEYFYDSRNLLVEQRDLATGTYGFDYDPVGQRIKLAYPNGVETAYSYDVAGRLANLLTRDPDSLVVDGSSYTYDGVGNRTSAVNLRDGTAETFQYDDLNRLSRWEKGAERFEEYTYDNVGNRLTLADEGGLTTFAYDGANRTVSKVREAAGGGTLTTSYLTDCNGRLLSQTLGAATTTYQWDALDRLVQVEDASGQVSYGYDGNGVRVRETVGGETRQLLYAPSREGFGEVVGIFDAAGDESAYFLHGPGIDEPLAQVGASGIQYIHRDGRWSVTALSSTDGRLAGFTAYSPFGGVEQTSGQTSRWGFTSRELDSTGLMYYRARYYQPDLGRFLSMDKLEGSPEIPDSLHRYAYVQNNPVNRVDPSGNFTLLAIVIGVVVGMIFGGALGASAFPWSRGVNIFLGAFAGGVVALILLGGVGSFFQLGSNLKGFFSLAKLSETQLEWTLFSRLFGRFFGLHYGRHIGGKILTHIHLGSTVLSGPVAVILTILAVVLVLVAVGFFIYSISILFYE